MKRLVLCLLVSLNTLFAHAQPQDLYISPSIGLLLGSANDAFTDGGTYQIVVGKQFNKLLGLGLSVGIDQYGYLVYPLSLEARGYFSGEKIVPYYSVQIGTGFIGNIDDTTLESKEGGIYLHPKFGLIFPFSDKLFFTTELGFSYQNLALTYDRSGFGRFTEEIDHRRGTFRIGLLF